MLRDRAVKHYKSGEFSCSESIIQAAIDENLIPEEYISVATSFSGGLSSGCLCGAIAGAQMIIGCLYGKGKADNARALAKQFVEEFKEAHKATCCKVLTMGKEFGSSERKENCTLLVEKCATILENIIKEN